ncbi:D-alanyl-D-alanine carboxypeptidase family protein [Oscillospiraceae bacterium MB08-C2-2]|nr:D-alanyl-D-alanine carboxypeptidase family protein [Oscillospiraceae bacterium MB08-C2-2]
MKKFAFLLAVLLTAFYITALPASADEKLSIVSEAAVLMDASTGQVLYQKNMDRKMYPASTTKIMTGILASQYSDMNGMVTVSEDAVKLPWDSSHIALSPGETLPLSELMYATMLASANDAANVVAEHVAGSESDFAVLMNQKAQEIGARNTHFVNPSGLHDSNHYTTAYDLALITRYGIQNPIFMSYFGTSHHTVPSTNLQPEERPLTNYQYMLLPESANYYADVIGGKVGYTREAQHTMSTVAVRDGRTLICVVLKSSNRNTKFSDTRQLLNYGFEQFSPVAIPKEQVGEQSAALYSGGERVGAVTFTAPQAYTVLLPSYLNKSDIQYKVDLPRAFDVQDMVASQVEYFAVDSQTGQRLELGNQPLQADFIYSADYCPVPSVIKVRSFGTFWPAVGKCALFVVLIPLGLGLLILFFMILKLFLLEFRFRRRLNSRRFVKAHGKNRHRTSRKYSSAGQQRYV